MRRRWLIPVPLAAGAGLLGWWLLPEDSVAPAPPEQGGRAYTYATAGFEEIDALGGARHVYPAATTVTFRRSGCGRAFVWRPLRDRSLAYELCDGRLRAIRDVHRFFGRTERRTYRCAPESSLRDGWRCVFDGTTEVARGRVVGVESVGGAEAVHVRLTTRLTGGVDGAGSRDFWLRGSDGFPVRFAATNESSTASVLGRVHFRERYGLTLREGLP